jgi:phenylacetate-CoA ligase
VETWWAARVAERMRGAEYNRKKEYRAEKEIQGATELSQWRATRTTELLAHASVHVPYYRRLCNDRGVVERGKIDHHSLSQFPMLTRDDITKNFDDLKSDDIATRKRHSDSSGGSTGVPVRFIHDDSYMRWSKATNYYYYKDILGINEPGCKKVLLWGSDRDIFQGTIGLKAKVENWLTNTVLLNSFRMTEPDMERYINVINRYKPDLIRGYASSLYELCRFAEKRHMALHRPKKLICAAESLRGYMREEIESVFATKAYDFYGSREIANIAGECDAGRLHLFDFWNCVELLDDTKTRHVSPGQEGAVVITNLFNYAMPLIRYEIGDMAVLGPEKCPCGNVLPTLKKVTGRSTDGFVFEDGTVVAGQTFTHLFGVYCNKGQLKQFQVIQEDYRKISINVVLEGSFDDADRKHIESNIRTVIGDCEITWHILDDIPSTESGKYEFVKSLVST